MKKPLPPGQWLLRHSSGSPATLGTYAWPPSLLPPGPGRPAAGRRPHDSLAPKGLWLSDPASRRVWLERGMGCRCNYATPPRWSQAVPWGGGVSIWRVTQSRGPRRLPAPLDGGSAYLTGPAPPHVWLRLAKPNEAAGGGQPVGWRRGRPRGHPGVFDRATVTSKQKPPPRGEGLRCFNVPVPPSNVARQTSKLCLIT